MEVHARRRAQRERFFVLTLRALLESRYEPLRSLPEADQEGLLSTEADVVVLRARLLPGA